MHRSRTHRSGKTQLFFVFISCHLCCIALHLNCIELGHIYHVFFFDLFCFCNVFVLQFAVLYFTALYCIVLYYNALYCIVLCCIVLYCIALYCIALHCIVLCCIVLYCIALHCIVLYCVVLYCNAFHSIVHLITLNYIFFLSGLANESHFTFIKSWQQHHCRCWLLQACRGWYQNHFQHQYQTIVIQSLICPSKASCYTFIPCSQSLSRFALTHKEVVQRRHLLSKKSADEVMIFL